jgi:hypothetical protein
MYMTSRMNAAELDSRFLRSLKAMLNGRDVEIVVCKPAQSEEDETAYFSILKVF